MPRTKTFLTPAEYAVLGLLRRKPAYGYELQRQLGAGSALGRVCPVEPAMVYAILKSLAGLELIDGEWDSSAYPPKAVYAATESGAAEFERWLGRPVARIREVRRDLLVKLFFLLDEDELPRALALLRQQAEVCRAYAREVEAELAGLPPAGFDAIALGARLSAARLTESWLSDCLRTLAAKEAARP